MVNEDMQTGILKACVLLVRAMLITKVHLIMENLALRQQLAISRQSVKRLKLRPRDRVFAARCLIQGSRASSTDVYSLIMASCSSSKG
jgi:hypothetical protein